MEGHTTNYWWTRSDCSLYYAACCTPLQKQAVPILLTFYIFTIFSWRVSEWSGWCRSKVKKEREVSGAFQFCNPSSFVTFTNTWVLIYFSNVKDRDQMLYIFSNTKFILFKLQKFIKIINIILAISITFNNKNKQNPLLQRTRHSND